MGDNSLLEIIMNPETVEQGFGSVTIQHADPNLLDTDLKRR